MSADLSSAASAPRGVLLVRLCNWVGEVVLSLPALRRLAAAGYQLHLYGKGWAPILLEGAGWPVTVRRGDLRQTTAQLRTLRRTIDSRTAPALLFTNSFESALETRLAGFAPSGFAREGRSILLRHAYPMPSFDPAAHSYWHLAGEFLGTQEAFPASLGPSWTPSDDQRTRAQSLAAQHGLAAGTFVVLCPFSGPDDRNNLRVWPGFRELAAALHDLKVPVVLCPGPGEELGAQVIAPNALQLPGIDLGVYGALLQLSRSVVANSTGPGHLAAAAGALLVSLYGPHSVAAWRPIGPHVHLFQDYSGWPSVDRVAEVVLATND